MAFERLKFKFALTCVYIDKAQLFIADSFRTGKLVIETYFKHKICRLVIYLYIHFR